MTARGLARRAERLVADQWLRPVVLARTRSWPARSRLFVLGDRSGWSIDDDAAQLASTATRLGYLVAPAAWARHARRQAVFLPSHFQALRPEWLASSHRLGLAYFHGRPGTGHPEFDAAFEQLRRHASRVGAVQVTHAEMHDLVLSAGVADDRDFRIPIGIDVEAFPYGDAAARSAARRALALPESAFVVGSFQKDGVGWEDGLQPKLVKGPDVFVKVVAELRGAVPELHVLLTGPARGYVRSELERLGVPYRHEQGLGRRALVTAYHALDAYVVTSRQEGGPKSVLESLASGAPLVSTRVGQAPEVVRDGVTGLLADVDDADAIAAGILRLREDPALAATLREAGRARAEAFSYRRLDPHWAPLLETLLGDGR